MLIMLLRRRKRASNNVWPARPHGDLSQRRLFTFSATKGEYVIHVHCISINLALLPPTTYSWEATADNADLLELGQGPTVTVVIPLFLSFVVDRFPFDYFRGGGPHLSIAQLATDGYRSEKCPCQVSSDGFSYFAPKWKIFKRSATWFCQKFPSLTPTLFSPTFCLSPLICKRRGFGPSG